jgi:hypothetical protein
MADKLSPGHDTYVCAADHFREVQSGQRRLWTLWRSSSSQHEASPGLWTHFAFAISMENITIYTASSVPGAASHPTLNCLQWTGDGQLLFSTKSSVYILVSPVNNAHCRYL